MCPPTPSLGLAGEGAGSQAGTRRPRQCPECPIGECGAMGCAHALGLGQGGGRKLSSDSRFCLSDLLHLPLPLHTPSLPNPAGALRPGSPCPARSSRRSRGTLSPQPIFSRRRSIALKGRRKLEGRFFRRRRRRPQPSAAVHIFRGNLEDRPSQTRPLLRTDPLCAPPPPHWHS